MELKLTIVISDDMVQSCANTAAASLFKAPDGWNDRTGKAGYALIAQQVEAAVKTLDFTDVAKQTAERFARGIIEDITKDAIKKVAKATVKQMQEAGELGI